ncbi:hypothetical protein ACFL27_27475 [candidate division CSSED10-310 bacterium]|uniref:Tetratricopeptide repeat protein n=1 Tax=candidate division CSSED10-310 bacterium TaxID=2855610 RepID=A0ABV6Z674_UNCC1
MSIPFYPKSRPGYRRAILLLLLALSFALYADSLGNEFVFDDKQLVRDNPSITSIDHIADFSPFTKQLAGYRPVRFLSYLLDHQIYGLNPAGFRLSNIIYHAINSYLVFRLALILSLEIEVALFTALIFLCHPVQTESVAYISGRRDLLFSLFYLLSFIYFARHFQRLKVKHTLIILLLMLCGMFSKEMAASLPLMLFWYALWFEYNQRPARDQSWIAEVLQIVRRSVAKAPLLFGLMFTSGFLFFLYIVYFLNPTGNPPYWGGSILNNFLTVNMIWVYYIGLILLPIPLKGDYSFAAFPVVTSPTEFLPWLCLVLLVFFFLSSITLMKRKPLITFACLWFAISLSPVSHIIPHHEMMAEHYLYLPLVGFALLLGWFLAALDKWGYKKISVILLVCLLVFYGSRTVLRSRDWRSSFTFWKSACRFEPLSARACLNLGLHYDKKGQEKKFLSYTNRSLSIKPSAKAYHNLATYYQEKNELDKAIGYYHKAISLDLSMPMSYIHLGYLYNELKLYDRAIRTFTSFRDYKNNADMLFALGFSHFKLRDYSTAISYFENVKHLKPEFEGLYYYLGLNYEKMNNYQAAAEEYFRGLTHKDKYYRQTYRHYNKCLGLLGRFQESLNSIKQYLVEFPDDHESKIRLARLYMMALSYEEAEKVYTEIVLVDPDCAECLLNLGFLNSVHHHNYTKAIFYLESALKFISEHQKRQKIVQEIQSLRKNIASQVD